jgi:large subunit ribosomal protein L31
MKSGIHPNYSQNTVVSCACGNSFTIGSTVKSVFVEVCSVCHPFWTGAEKFVDTEGRVDKFVRKVSSGDKARKEKIQKLKEKIEHEKKKEDQPKSLKDMLKSMQ